MNNTVSNVLSSNKIDKYGILKFYKDYVDLVDRAYFVEYCLSEAKSADIIHLHSVDALVYKIRRKYGKKRKSFYIIMELIYVITIKKVLVWN
jgi:hypothetical protein